MPSFGSLIRKLTRAHFAGSCFMTSLIASLVGMVAMDRSPMPLMTRGTQLEAHAPRLRVITIAIQCCIASGRK